MKYFMHGELEIPYKLGKKIRNYFNSIATIESEVIIKGKRYRAIVDADSFLHPANFDCFNCLTNCCVQFPYEFNSKAREIILENLSEYDELTKAISILREEGLSEEEILSSIEKDPMLIPKNHVKNTFDRCTCSCVYIDRNLCALHKICIDRGMSLEEIIDAKPLWCSIYPLEILSENDESLLYIFVPTEENGSMSMNDSDFPCMNIGMSKTAKFRRENPIGFKEEDYKPFILAYRSVLRYILGEKIIDDLMYELDLQESPNGNAQYERKIK